MTGQDDYRLRNPMQSIREISLSMDILAAQDAADRLAFGEYTTEEEYESLEKMVLRGRQARNELVVQNMNLVPEIVEELRAYYDSKNEKPVSSYIEIEDLIQVGNLALVEASSKFDYTRGTFEKFAFKCISNKISRKVYCLTTYKKNNIEFERIEDLIAAIEKNPANRNNGNFFVEDDVEFNAVTKDFQNRMNKYLERLPQKYQGIIRMYYYENKTMQEIADKYNTSKENVSSYLRKGLRKLRSKSLEGSELYNYEHDSPLGR